MGIMLLLALVFFITTMYFLLQQDKKEKQIQNALKQKELEALKAGEEYAAQFKPILQVRKKFKSLKGSKKILIVQTLPEV
jgi:predicted PurR-regulated permease PerM